MADKTADHPFDRLLEVVRTRALADPSESYTARLLARGLPKAAQKLGEEAVEAVIEAVRGDREALAAESADLLYHLAVLWIAAGVDPKEVWEILEGRRGQSGLEEKKSRKMTGATSGTAAGEA